MKNHKIYQYLNFIEYILTIRFQPEVIDIPDILARQVDTLTHNLMAL